MVVCIVCMKVAGGRVFCKLLHTTCRKSNRIKFKVMKMRRDKISCMVVHIICKKVTGYFCKLVHITCMQGNGFCARQCK